MAIKFIALIVFAVAVQAETSLETSSSNGSTSLQTYKKITLAAWKEIADIFYYTLVNTTLPIEVAKTEFISSGSPGDIAFFKATVNSDNLTHAQLDGLYARNVFVTDLVYGAVEVARNATNYEDASTKIDDYFNQLPLQQGVARFFRLINSNASQTEVSTTLTEIYGAYRDGVKALAAYSSGKSSTIDTSTKTPVLALIIKYVKIIFGLIQSSRK